MIVQLGNLFINTENVVTISSYGIQDTEETDLGIVINGIKYNVYKVKNDNKELLEANQAKINGIINTIVNILAAPVSRLKLEDDNG